MKLIKYQLMTENIREFVVPVERVDEYGQLVYEEVPVRDVHGWPILDEDGNPITESKVVIDYETKRETTQTFTTCEIRCKEETLEANLAIAKAEAYNSEVTVEDVPQTEEEVRAQRDKLLAETDWTQVADAPIDSATRSAMRIYRQALRDITEQEGFPTNVVWPEMPVIVKATPEPIDEVVEAIIGVEVTE